MAPPISNATAIDLSRVRPQAVRQLPTRGNSNPLSKSRFRLLNVLQTTLDLEVLLDLFKQELETNLRIKGFCYLNETCHVQIKKGESDLHSCAYRLIVKNENLGELIFYRDNRFNEFEMDSLEALLSVLISPVRNALLYQKALAASLTDPLTGAGNRLALNSQISREISRSRRHQMPLSALMIDIDKFKYINDSCGHATGDLVLKELAKVIDKVNRDTDSCFRYGGEEFVVLLGNTDRIGAEAIATRLCRAICANRISSESGLLQITVSIGVSTMVDTDEQDSLLSRADKAMYKGKGMGGNTIAWL